jgi:uncharacterized protein involved in oxidation of intracellular sulfur
MKVLIIFNREPYDNTDVTWNGLRLTGKLLEAGQDVRIFLMNDAVDMARDACKPPENYDQDLSQMLKDLIAKGVPAILTRCGSRTQLRMALAVSHSSSSVGRNQLAKILPSRVRCGRNLPFVNTHLSVALAKADVLRRTEKR